MAAKTKAVKRVIPGPVRAPTVNGVVQAQAAPTHALAQKGRMLDGRLVPDPSGAWVLACNGAPSSSAAQARTHGEATCLACIALLKPETSGPADNACQESAQTMRKDPDDSHLCIRLQPIEDGKWMWNVGYPHGVTYEHGEADSPENAVATAKVALRLLSRAR